MHLHVLSADLVSENMKTKKHYNTFHPERGFFIPYDEVMSWFEAEESFWKQVRYFLTWCRLPLFDVSKKSALRPSTYEPLLKEQLECFHCCDEFTYMPALKKHLESEFDTIKERERAKVQMKRKLLAAKAKRQEAKEAAARAKGETSSPDRKRPRIQESLSDEPVSHTDASMS